MSPVCLRHLIVGQIDLRQGRHSRQVLDPFDAVAFQVQYAQGFQVLYVFCKPRVPRVIKSRVATQVNTLGDEPIRGILLECRSRTSSIGTCSNPEIAVRLFCPRRRTRRRGTLSSPAMLCEALGDSCCRTKSGAHLKAVVVEVEEDQVGQRQALDPPYEVVLEAQQLQALLADERGADHQAAPVQRQPIRPRPLL